MTTDLGPFHVSAAADEVAAFRRAAGLEVSETLPFTWPIRWLARPEIRAALVALMPEGDLVPFHESQTFDYAAPLETEVAYVLEAVARREHGPPDRLVVDARIKSNEGTTTATIETVLRLFPTGETA